ncbi:uncharacterized protein LOC144867309 [Branchiostoma floridae x Branchiostoma japonicum]
MAGNMKYVFLAGFLLMTFHCNSSGQDQQQQQTMDVRPGDDLILQFNPTDTNEVFLVKKKQGEVQVIALLRWSRWTAGSIPADPEIQDPALDDRVESSYDQDTNTLTVRIYNFQLSDTGPGVYYEFQQSHKTSSQFYPNVIAIPAPPTDLAVIATKLYSVEVGITGGNEGLAPQSLCLWYQEQGTEEWKKGKGENSCRNEVREGENITLQSTLPAANTTYQICVVAQNRFNSTRCEDAYSHATTDSVASFNATIRLPSEPYKSLDRNHRENQELVTRIIHSVNNALQPAYPDLEVEVVQFREGSVLADLNISVGLREIEDLKDDLVAVVRSGRLRGVDVDKNYLLIDNEIPLVPEDSTDQLVGAQDWLSLWKPVLGTVLAGIVGVVAYCLCRNKDFCDKRDTRIKGDLPAPVATEKSIFNVRLPDVGFHQSADCKNIAKAGNSLVVIGSTGSGKTQGVLAYAQKFKKDNTNAVMWFFGRSQNEEKGLTKETILEQGMELAKELGKEKLSHDVLPNTVMESLQDRQSKSLLIFDDITLTSEIPAAYLFACEKVTVFITTRSANLDLNLPEYKMEGFAEVDVLEFIKRKDKKSVEIFGKTSDEDLLKLARHFGNLPHGLSLARSYMLSSRTTVEGYLHELERRSKGIHGQAVYGAIQLAMEKRMSGTSQEMLKSAAILSQDRIPVFILSKETEDKDEFIKEVEDLSLARVEGTKGRGIDGRMISVHQQTQAAIRSKLDEEKLETMTRSLIQAFLQYFHKDTRKIKDGYINGLLLPHVEAVLNLPTIGKLPEEFYTGLARLYETIGYMYCQKRLPEAAIFPLEKAKEIIGALVPLNTDADTIFQSLAEKGRELYGKGDVYSKSWKTRVLTTDDVKVLQTKEPTLSDDVGNPLTEDQHKQLVQLHLAYNTEQIQQSFLVELAATVLYTSARRIFYFQGTERVKYRQTALQDLNLSFALSQKLAITQKLYILNTMLSQRSGLLYLLKETEGKSPKQQKKDFCKAIEIYQGLIEDDSDYFENGILKKIGDDDWHRMYCYRGIVDCYSHLLTDLATTDQERAAFICLYDKSASKMVAFGEKQVKKDDKGEVVEGPEMLPEIYNMSGDFLIEMMEKGFVKQEDVPLDRVKLWYHKALDVTSIKPHQEAASRLGLAKVYTLMYEAEKVATVPTTNGETRVHIVDTVEEIPLDNRNLTNREIHHLINAQEEINKSLKIYDEKLRTRTEDIEQAQKWKDRIVCHMDMPNIPREQESAV